jgi:hypothetical protein
MVVVLTFPGIIIAPLLFPAGLPRLFGVQQTEASQRGTFIVLGWIIYLALSVAAYLTSRKGVYLVLYVTLCILLALNAAGCRVFLNEITGVR